MNMMNEDDLYKVCIDQENGGWTVMAWCRFLGYAKSICEACQGLIQKIFLCNI